MSTSLMVLTFSAVISILSLLSVVYYVHRQGEYLMDKEMGLIRKDRNTTKRGLYLIGSLPFFIIGIGITYLVISPFLFDENRREGLVDLLDEIIENWPMVLKHYL